MKKLEIYGKWDDGVNWKFYQSKIIPERRLCTAVFCVLFSKLENGIILTRTKNRGHWELLGGHIEENESIEQALYREAMEEGGVKKIDNLYLFGLREMNLSKIIKSKSTGLIYPLKSYIPHYIGFTNLSLSKPSGEDVLKSKLFKFDEICEKLTKEKMPSIDILKQGMAYVYINLLHKNILPKEFEKKLQFSMKKNKFV